MLGNRSGIQPWPFKIRVKGRENFRISWKRNGHALIPHLKVKNTMPTVSGPALLHVPADLSSVSRPDYLQTEQRGIPGIFRGLSRRDYTLRAPKTQV